MDVCCWGVSGTSLVHSSHGARPWMCHQHTWTSRPVSVETHLVLAVWNAPCRNWSQLEQMVNPWQSKLSGHKTVPIEEVGDVRTCQNRSMVLVSTVNSAVVNYPLTEPWWTDKPQQNQPDYQCPISLCYVVSRQKPLSFRQNGYSIVKSTDFKTTNRGTHSQWE